MYNYIGDEYYGADRLIGTLCTVDGYPSHIRDVLPGKVYHRPLLAQEYKKSPIDLLDPTPVSIGYVNSDFQCAYFSRLPWRQWKQGI